MKLPFSENARVDQSKATGYLLAFDHPEGASKAEFFCRFGFHAGEWEILADALITHGRTHDVSSAMESDFGMKYRVDGSIFCPDGRNPTIRSVWIIDRGSDSPRLVTAYPL